MGEKVSMEKYPGGVWQILHPVVFSLLQTQPAWKAARIHDFRIKDIVITFFSNS